MSEILKYAGEWKDFSYLFNEVMEKSKGIVKPYYVLKRELRKTLMIDAKW